MSHIIKLEQFEGPLDALLQIIEQQKLDISEVSLAEVTDQYLQYIESIEIDPIEIADFLTVAAKLLLIKSRILLPFAEELEDNDVIDLAEQLKRYQQYIELSKKIAMLWNQPQQMYERHKLHIPSQIQAHNQFISPKNVTAKSLLLACTNILEKIKPLVQLPERTIRKVISLREKIEHLSQRLKRQAEIYFHEILEDKDDASEKIVSFLAMLELVKQREISIDQTETFADIIVRRL